MDKVQNKTIVEQKQLLAERKTIISDSLSIALQRCNASIDAQEWTVKDLEKQFRDTSINKITAAIKEGAFGSFGVIYGKTLSTQVIGHWIYSFLRKPKSILDALK